MIQFSLKRSSEDRCYLLSVSYQWLRSDWEEQGYEEIPGATDKTYLLNEDDIDQFIKVKVTVIGKYTGTITSAPLGKVEWNPQELIELISIEDIIGTAMVGEELTAGEIEPTGATVSYQWLRSDWEEQGYEEIPGATDRTYLLKEDDIDKFIMVKVTVTGIGKYTGSITSAPLGKVEDIS